MTTAKLKFGLTRIGECPTIEVAGTDLSRLTRGATVSVRAGDLPTIHLDLILHSVDVDGEGLILINTTPINDTVGRLIFERLSQRYGGRT